MSPRSQNQDVGPSGEYTGSKAYVLSVNSGGSPYTLVDVNEEIQVDASAGAITVNLTPSPTAQSTHRFQIDVVGNPVTVGRNGQTIRGAAADYTLLVGENEWAEFWWDAISDTWQITESSPSGQPNADVTVTELTSADSPYTVLATDEVLDCDCSGGAITLNLPASLAGHRYSAKKIDSSGNLLTLDPNGAETIDGSSTLIMSVQYDAATLVGIDSDWKIY